MLRWKSIRKWDFGHPAHKLQQGLKLYHSEADVVLERNISCSWNDGTSIGSYTAHDHIQVCIMHLGPLVDMIAEQLAAAESSVASAGTECC